MNASKRNYLILALLAVVILTAVGWLMWPHHDGSNLRAHYTKYEYRIPDSLRFEGSSLIPRSVARRLRSTWVLQSWWGVHHRDPEHLNCDGVAMTIRDEIAKGLEIQGGLRRAGANFVQTELDTSLTFAYEALSAGDSIVTRERNRANARKGYDTLLRFSQKFPVEPSEEQEFTEKLRNLKSALEGLGERGL